jgi:hypothetical protein
MAHLFQALSVLFTENELSAPPLTTSSIIRNLEPVICLDLASFFNKENQWTKENPLASCRFLSNDSYQALVRGP